MHADRAESQQLKGRVVAQIAKHPNDDNMHCVLDGEETAGGTAAEKAASLKKANRQLYGLLIDQIKNPSLVEYLQEHHESQGQDALAYIMGCFGKYIPESSRPLDMMPQLELGWSGPSPLLACPTYDVRYDVLRLGPCRVGL